MVTMNARRVGAPLAASALVLIWLSAAPAAAGDAPATGYQYTRYAGPARTVATDSTGRWVATFTDGARTVAMTGPPRVFAEATTTSTVTSNTWVRLQASPFTGTVDTAWLAARLADISPDVFAKSMQYIQGAPPVADEKGTVIAADASYGPLQPDGTRAEGSDFNDFLGVSWTYAGAVDAPEPDNIAASTAPDSCAWFGATEAAWHFRWHRTAGPACPAGPSRC